MDKRHPPTCWLVSIEAVQGLQSCLKTLQFLDCTSPFHLRFFGLWGNVPYQTVIKSHHRIRWKRVGESIQNATFNPQNTKIIHHDFHCNLLIYHRRRVNIAPCRFWIFDDVFPGSKGDLQSSNSHTWTRFYLYLWQSRGGIVICLALEPCGRYGALTESESVERGEGGDSSMVSE